MRTAVLLAADETPVPPTRTSVYWYYSSENLSPLVTPDFLARAIEVALLLDRDVKRQRLRDALDEMRRRLDAIRRSGGEHADMQEIWERRLGRRFTLPEVKGVRS